MNRRHVMQSSPVQQMMAAGNPNLWNINNMRAPLTMSSQASSSPFQSPPPHHPSFLSQFQPTTNSSSLPFLPSWHDDDGNNNNNQYPNQNQDHLPESWSQFLIGGGLSEDDKANGTRQLVQQAKKLEDWEEHMYSHQAHSISRVNDDVKKQEDSLPQGSFVYGHHGNNSSEGFQSIALSQMLPTRNNTAAASASSPKSSSVTSFGSGVLDFSGKPVGRHPPPSRSSSECNSSVTGGPVKKARVQPSSSSSSPQPIFKVRKEKLGDRITSLHQLVSPFGKTDTASVLLEVIGYIRFLHNQIEALSLPYLGSGSPNMRLQQQSSSIHGERNCMFPEDPGQLLNDNCMKMKGINSEQDAYQEVKKDLRSRGLCLVPVSCTLQVGSDNGADYWAPAALGGGFQ